MACSAKVADSIALLRESVQRYGRVVYSSSLGVESIVLTDLIWEHAPQIDIFTVDTGRLPDLAAELVRLAPDVIVTGGNPVIAAVRRTATTIPVVMGISRDPVGAGFVASNARPGGNVTGLASDPMPDVLGKDLEVFKEIVPRAQRVSLLGNPVPPGADTYRKVAENAAQRLGVAMQVVEVRERNDLEAACDAMVRERADGV